MDDDSRRATAVSVLIPRLWTIQMNRYGSRFILVTVCTTVLCGQSRPAPPAGDKRPANKVVTEQECTAAKLGTSIPQASIGLPISSVVLNAPQWHAEGNGGPAFC